VKIFISWSGQYSLPVARALHRWLPRVLQAVQPYLSVEDTAKGAYWFSKVKQELDEASFGIICLTPDNLEAPWIHFEAGALSKSIERGSVTPLLFNVSPDALTGPLTQFQVTELSKQSDMLQLIKDLDVVSDRPVGEKVAEESFEVWWPRLQRDLEQVTVPPARGQRPVDDMVREILERQRTQERLLADSIGPLSSRFMDALVRQAAALPGPEVRAELENALQELEQALDACARSDDPAVGLVAAQVTKVRVVHERMNGSHRQWEPLRKRATGEQRALPFNGA
jgi:TIR domain